MDKMLIWGRHLRGQVASITWDNVAQRAVVIYRDENGTMREVYAEGASKWEARQAVLDDLMHRATVIREAKQAARNALE